MKQGGKTIPAVVAMNKVGLLFLLDRVTGKPIYGVEERPVPPSEVPLERASKTQPFPLKPPPLVRMTMRASDIATVTPELEKACKELIEGVQLGGPLPAGELQPPARAVPRQSRRRQLVRDVVQSATGLSVRQHERAGAALGSEGSRSEDRAGLRATGTGNRVDPDGPYEGVPGGGRFSVPGSDSQQLPCQQPPWGELTAVNVNTGEFAWRVPLGVTDSLPPDKQKTGRPGNGGTIATAGGLVFVGATDDSRFRAFDAKTGKELWTFKLGGAAEATPMTYQGQDGKQYVVITSTGGGFFGNPMTDDSIMAFALDDAK